MTLPVVCECGIRKEVPDQWRGKRVKCTCGRRFVVGAKTEVEQPPVAAPLLREPETVSSGRPGSSDAAVPGDQDQAPPIAPADQRESVATRYRARHKANTHRKRATLGGLAAVILLCLMALVVVSRNGLTPPPHKTNHGNVAGEDLVSRTPKKQRPRPGAEGDEVEAMSPLDHEMGSLDDPSAQTLELEADDGLLLTGFSEPVPAPLDLSAEQSDTIEALKSQFEKKANELKSGEIELSEWFLEGQAIAKSLLAVLSDEQRGQLRGMIEQEEITRVRLEQYAAEIRPELETPIVAWDVEPDGVKGLTIETCSLSLAATGSCLRTVAPSGILAIATETSETLTYDVLDLGDDRRIGRRRVPPAAPADVTLLSRDGRFIVRGGEHRGQYRVAVWPVESSSSPKIKSLPQPESGDAASAHHLVDCVADRVLCVSERGFWVWDLGSDQTRESRFADWVPRDVPTCAISPGGRYVVMTHRHRLVVDSRNYHFLEISLHDLVAGKMVGNSIVAPDYRPFQVRAIAFSHDGRELALVCKSEDSPATRRLTHLSALDGEVIGPHRELPLSADERARQNPLNHRDLMWLPEKTGWVVDLELLVDTQSELVIDLEVPERLSIAPSHSRSSVMPVADDFLRRESDQGEHGWRRAAFHPEKSNRLKSIIVEAIPAGNHRLLLITLNSSPNVPSEKKATAQFIELPEISPFL